MWYSNHSVVGLFIEGAYKGPGGDFQVLKDYLVGRMLWHPQPTIVDANKATQLSDTEELSSFLEGYYGPAASLVELYMATIHGAVALSDKLCTTWDEPNCLNIGCGGSMQTPYLPPLVLIEAASILSRAEAACGSAKHAWRVQQLSIGVFYVALFRWDEVAAADGGSAAFCGGKVQAWERFSAICNRMGVVNLKETEGYGLAWMQQALKLPNATQGQASSSSSPSPDTAKKDEYTGLLRSAPVAKTDDHAGILSHGVSRRWLQESDVGLLPPLDRRLCILPLGDSITQGDENHASWRHPLWRSLLDARPDTTEVVYTGQMVNHWPQPLGVSYPQASHAGLLFPPHHEGHWGWTTEQVLQGGGSWGGGSLSDWMESYSAVCTPTCVLIHIGTNDVCRTARPAATVITNIRSIIRQLSERFSSTGPLRALVAA